MDTALINGDFKVSSNGRPEQIDGTQELLQRAAIRLNVPLGSFVYDAQLGSRLHSLKAEDDALNAKALAMPGISSPARCSTMRRVLRLK